MRWRLELILWVTTLAFGALSLVAWRRRTLPAVAAPASTMTGPAPIRQWDADSLANVAERVVEKDPFRLERRPSLVAYDPSIEMAPGSMPAMRPPRAALVLSGILGGPPWQALLEGVPGRTGTTVLSAGDTVGDIRIRLVTRDSVIVQSRDTTWRLGVRRSW